MDIELGPKISLLEFTATEKLIRIIGNIYKGTIEFKFIRADFSK